MRAIAADRKPCKNGWTNQDAAWRQTRAGQRNHSHCVRLHRGPHRRHLHLIGLCGDGDADRCHHYCATDLSSRKKTLLSFFVLRKSIFTFQFYVWKICFNVFYFCFERTEQLGFTGSLPKSSYIFAVNEYERVATCFWNNKRNYCNAERTNHQRANCTTLSRETC